MQSRDERQEEARIKWIKNKCKGSIEACTGFGKTRVAINCLKSIINKYPTKKFLVIVPTITLKDQWVQQLDLTGLSLNGEVMVINSAIKNLYKTDILVIDECHRAAAETLIQVFEKIDYKYILGLTATFERLDNRHELLEKYCPVIDRITTEEALLNGWIANYKEYQILIDVDDIDSYKEYNKRFTEHFEFFNFEFDTVMSLVGKDGFRNRLKLRDQMCRGRYVSEEERKNILKSITYHSAEFIRAIQARKSFINNHPKKIEIARRIIEARPNAKIITFSNNIKMAESIGYGFVYTGKDSKKKSRITLEEFSQCKSGVINSVSKLNEGADVKDLSVAIILGLDSSETKSVQRRGRTVRKENNKIAEIFNIVINQTVESKWYETSHKSSSYITIDENGLNDVLAGKEPKPYIKKIKDFQFRF